MEYNIVKFEEPIRRKGFKFSHAIVRDKDVEYEVDGNTFTADAGSPVFMFESLETAEMTLEKLS